MVVVTKKVELKKVGGPSSHRADYCLERGIWWATCRDCGLQVADPVRRQAATRFRGHIAAMRTSEPSVTPARDAAIEET
ncbi:MAG: hypothetical protein ACRDYC_10795 [Acidimicrobiales bacterium]